MSGLPMKHAFLIMAYKDYWMLNQIVQSIDDERNDIYIHMDIKAKDFKEKFITSTKHSKVSFTERIDVSWAGDSKIKCIILLFNYAYNNGVYRYYHLMTESDYVIKDLDHFHNFFINNDGKEFVDFREPLKKMSRFYDQYRFFQNEMGRNTQYPELYPIEQNLLKKQIQNNIHRVDNELIYYRSEGVFSLTSDFVLYILNNIGFIAKNFFNGIYADEYFISTLIMNSEFKKNLYSNNIRLIDWVHRTANVPHPITFTCSHYDLIINSDCLFARKFNSFVDYKIISLINQNIHNRDSVEQLNIISTVQDIYDMARESDYTVCIPLFIVGKTILDCFQNNECSNYHYILRDADSGVDETIVNDKCLAVLYNEGNQCSSIKIGDIFYTMEPVEGYHFFFIQNGKVDGCIIDVNARVICNPLIKKVANKADIPVLIDEDKEMLRSESSWQRYIAVRKLLSRPYIEIDFKDVVIDLLTDDSPYSNAALASLYKDKRLDCYDLEKACDCLYKAIRSNEIWIIEQWTLELFEILQSIGTNDSYRESIKVLEPLLSSDDGRAIGCLAKCYRYGRGVEKNLNEAAQLMKKAADQDVRWAERSYFDILWEINTPESMQSMIEYAQHESDHDNMDLRGRLARAYRDGKGVDRDLFRASKLMKEAADNRIGWAKWEYFDILWKINTPESLEKMVDFAQIESDYGNMELRARLARAYRDGKGVDRDLRKAADLMRSVHGEKPRWAKREYFDILWNMRTPETDSEMFQFIESLLNTNDKEYQIRSAMCYRDGRGVEKDMIKAAKLMKAAADQGSVKAKLEYADILWSMKNSDADRQLFDYLNVSD